MTTDATHLRTLLQEECRRLGSQKIWAERHGVSESCVSDVLIGRRGVSRKIARYLGYELHAVYVPGREKAAGEDYQAGPAP